MADNKNYQSHWDQVYNNTEACRLGWYESTPEPSLKLVKPGGFVILAAFHLNGAAKCSGLPVHRYDQQMMAEKLGSGFELHRAFGYTHTMPSGDKREYIYTLFERK